MDVESNGDMDGDDRVPEGLTVTEHVRTYVGGTRVPLEMSGPRGTPK